jgi:nucleotide-binding universal stress UspA family protein
MPSFRTIVAAVDFSDISGEVLEMARDMARLHQARLHVVHAVGDPFRSLYSVENTGLDLPALLRQWTDAAQRQMASLLEAQPIEPGLLTTAVLPGSPTHAIVEYAEQQDADLIVIGSHGRGAVSRLLLGSVAERILHVAGRPVFVVAHRHRQPTPSDVKAAAGVSA